MAGAERGGVARHARLLDFEIHKNENPCESCTVRSGTISLCELLSGGDLEITAGRDGERMRMGIFKVPLPVKRVLPAAT